MSDCAKQLKIARDWMDFHQSNDEVLGYLRSKAVARKLASKIIAQGCK